MAKSTSIEQQLAVLTALRPDTKTEPAKAELDRALASKSNLVAAKAAGIITDSQQADFLPRLAAAFDRFFAEGCDKGCSAKTALANALYRLGHNEAGSGLGGFLRGIHHIQKEVGFGPPMDVAAELRAGTGEVGISRCPAGIGRTAGGCGVSSPDHGRAGGGLHRFGGWRPPCCG